MYLDEVVTFFRILADEPDNVFIPNSALIPILKTAYFQYHRMITDCSDNPFSTTLDIVAPTQDIDLTLAPNNILGVAPFAANKRMDRLNSVSSVSISGINTAYTNVFTSAGSITEFGGSRKFLYILQDKKLKFNTAINASLPTLQLNYTYFPNIDFNKITPGDNEQIDEFAQFHDIISLLMYKMYAIKDVAVNIPMENQLVIRSIDLKSFFEQGQNFSGNHYVQSTYRR